MFAKLLSPKSSKLSRSGLTRRNNSSNNNNNNNDSNKQRKEDGNGLENVSQCCPPDEIALVTSNTSETVPVKLMTQNEPSPVPVVTNKNNNNNNNVININNQRNQHNQQHHHADLSSPESSSSSYCNEKWRRRTGGNNGDGQRPNGQLIVDDATTTDLISPSTYHDDDNGANQSTNCAQVNEKHQKHQQQHIDNHDNLNSNTMTVDSDYHLTTSSLVNEAYRTECIQLRQRVRELEQQNRLLTLLLAEQLLNSSTNSVGNQSKLDKLMAINSLTNNQPQLISEYESSILMDNNGNHDDEVSNIIMNLSSSPGQGQMISSEEGKGTTSESDFCRSMGNNHPDHHHHHHQSNNNNHHHHDDDETSDRLVSMSECNSMLGVNLTHVNIDRWGMMRVDDKSNTITTTTTTTTTSTAQQSTLQPNLPVNQLNNQLLPSSRATSINSVNCKPISSLSFGYLDSRKKSSYINNLVTNNSTFFTSSSSSSTSSSNTNTITTVVTATTSSSSTSSTSSSSGPFSASNTVLPTLPDTTSTTTTISTLTSTLIGSPSSSSPPQSPKKLISTPSILDSSLFQSTTTSTNNPVNCSSSSTNQLEKRILFILASNNNQCYNSTFSSTSSSSSSVSTENNNNNNNKINCDNTNRLINKPGNLTLRTLSGSSSSLKDNNNSLISSSSIKSIVSLEKDSPASSATSFDSNGELTSKDEGYSTMSSDVQSDIGGSINNTGSSSIVTINTGPLTTTVTPTTTTINNQNELTINSLYDDKQSTTINNGNTTKINKSFIILNSPPSRTNQPPPPQSQSTSSLSTLIHLKQHQQLKGETIEIKSEPKKMGINGSPTNSIPLTIMSIVNPIVVGSSRLTTFKSSNQNDCLSSPPTINNNGKNNKMESLYEEDVNLLSADTIKLNCNNNGNTVTTISNNNNNNNNNNNSSQSIVRTTIKTGNINSNLLADNKSSSWLNNNTDGTATTAATNEGNESQLVNCFTSLFNNNGPNFIRKSRKTANCKSSTHRYTFPPVTTRTVTTTTTAFDGIEWTPCLIYQPSKSTFDPNVENLINESRLIVTAEKSTSADFDNDKDETKCLVNNRGLINCEEKRKRSGKYHHHHHHLGKDDYVNDDQQQFDGKTNEVNQVKSESVGETRIKVGGGGGRRKSSVSKVTDSGSLVMKVTRNTFDDEDEYDENEEEDEEIEIHHHKIDQKRKLKVHHKLQAPPPPGSSSSSYESHSLTRWHSDSQLYSDSLVKQDAPLKVENGKQLHLGRPPSNHHHRSPRNRHRDITSVHLPSQSFSPSTGKRSSGYIRRRIKREDRARLDESHRWSTLSTSSSALSDGLEAPPIYFERRRCRPRLSITTDCTVGSIGTNLKNTTGPSGRLSKYISSDENHSADDEDSAERFVSRWLHKSGGGLRWDDSEVTWKLNESIDWPEPCELEDSTCLNHLSPYITNTTSSPSSSTSAAAIKPPSSSSDDNDDDDEDDNRITNHLNYNDDTFEEIPLIDDDSSESEKIEITTTINSNNYHHHHNHLRNSYSVLISPCDEEVGCNGIGGGIDVSHEGGGEGYVSSDQASSVPDDGLTPETHFNGDFYRLCSVGSRTSLQQPDDEISLPPSSSGALSSLSSSPPLTDVKEQDEEEQDDNFVKNNANYQNDNGTNLQQLTNLNDLDNDYDELLIITTTTSIDGKNHHQLKSSKSFNYPNEKQTSSLIKSQSSGFSGQQSSSQSPVVKLDQSNQQQIVTDLKQINSSQSTKCLSLSSSSPGKSVKFGQFNINDNEKMQTSTSTISTGSESQSIDCKQVSKGRDEQLNKPINAVEQPINNDSSGHQTVKDNCHIYEEINQTESSQLTTKPVKPLLEKVNCYPKPNLIKSSSTNQASSSPTRIPLPKQSNSLDAIKPNNKDGVKLRFNSTTTATMIDSITNNHNNNNNVNNLISKSFINQHQVKRLNNNMMVNHQQQQQFIQPSTSSQPSSSSASLLMSKKIGTESRSKMMMIELKGKMERNNNQVNHNRSSNRNKSNQSIPSLEEFERRLSEDKQMADKIREFYSIFEQSTQSSSSSLPAATTTTTTTTSPPTPTKPATITTTSTSNSTVTSTIPPSIKPVKSNRSRSTISGDLVRGIKLGNNEKPVFEDIKSKLNYPKLLRSKGVVGSGSTGSGAGSGCGGGNNNNTIGSDSGKTMKEGHETSWVHVSGFTVGKISEQPPPSSLTSPSPLSAINSITTSINCNNNNVKNVTNSGKLSSDSCSSEDEFNLGKIQGNGNGGKKRSSFHQRLLALHRSRRQRKRASDCYMGMSFLPKIRASIVDRLDFYHRFGDKEQEALTSFNFLNDLPPTTTTTTTNNNNNASTTSITTHSNPKSPKSFDSSGSINFVEEQQLLLRCYLNSFQPLTTSSSTQSLPPPPPLPQPPSSSSPSSSSSSFTLSSYKWPQSPVKSSSSSPNRYQSSVGNNYILNHELTKRPVGGVS